MSTDPHNNDTRKIFCIGLCRTGTTSLHAAFEAFGLRSKHFPYGLFEQPFAEEIEQADAFSDLPIPLYYRQYAEQFPSARFILTTRDEQSWLQSMDWLIRNGPKLWGGPGSTWEPGGVVEQLFTKLFGTTRFEPEKLLAVYRAHNAEVLEFFANDSRFLHLRLEDTMRYEDLATFLEISTDLRGPLPRANVQRRASNSLIRRIIRRIRSLR
jgi:hypothetical protein